jgi:hypothetical protein
MATGREIKQIYDAMLKICEETSKLISTVNDMFIDKGFQPVGNTGVMWETSTSFQHPYYWLPYFQQRVFSKQRTPDKGIGFNNTFDNMELKNVIPFVSCGLINAYGGQQVSKSDEFCKAGWLGEKISKLPNTVFYLSDYPGKYEITNYFLPLDVLTGKDKVDELVIKPLIALYKGQQREANELVKDAAITVEIIKGL